MCPGRQLTERSINLISLNSSHFFITHLQQSLQRSSKIKVSPILESCLPEI
jgi:hypothetical protein